MPIDHFLSLFSSSEAVPDQSSVFPSSEERGTGCIGAFPVEGLKSKAFGEDLSVKPESECTKGIFPRKVLCAFDGVGEEGKGGELTSP